MITVFFSPLDAWSLHSGEAVLPYKKQDTTVRTTVTGLNETPIPVDLGPSGIFAHATGQIVVVESPDQFAKKTTEFINKMGFIPVDEADELVIDQLVEKHAGTQELRPLNRQA